MSAGSGSLRDLYSSPPTSWTFIPPPTNGSSSSSNSSPPSEPSYQWNARPRHNSIYELSPDLSLEPTAPNAVALLRAAAASAVLQYFSSAVENPWEVGKTLLQVQHVPREATAIEYTEYVEAEDEVCCFFKKCVAAVLINVIIYFSQVMNRLLRTRKATLPMRMRSQVHNLGPLARRMTAATLCDEVCRTLQLGRTGCCL